MNQTDIELPGGKVCVQEWQGFTKAFPTPSVDSPTTSSNHKTSTRASRLARVGRASDLLSEASLPITEKDQAMRRIEFEAQIVAKAWKDSAFREALKKDPKGKAGRYFKPPFRFEEIG